MIEKLSKKEFRSVNYDIVQAQLEINRDKDNFPYRGIYSYVGLQGRGKTITLVHHLLKMKEKYPKSVVYSNLLLNVDFEYDYMENIEDVRDVLRSANNDKYGVIVVLDEIQSYFNSLQSKSLDVRDVAAVCQQRKRHMVILSSVQLFTRLAKAFREQCSRVIKCNTHFNVLSTYSVFDGETLEIDDKGKYVGKKLKGAFYFQTRKLRDSYDTYQLIELQTNSGSSMYVD